MTKKAAQDLQEKILGLIDREFHVGCNYSVTVEFPNSVHVDLRGLRGPNDENYDTLTDLYERIKLKAYDEKWTFDPCKEFETYFVR